MTSGGVLTIAERASTPSAVGHLPEAAAWDEGDFGRIDGHARERQAVARQLARGLALLRSRARLPARAPARRGPARVGQCGNARTARRPQRRRCAHPARPLGDARERPGRNARVARRGARSGTRPGRGGPRPGAGGAVAHRRVGMARGGDRIRTVPPSRPASRQRADRCRSRLGPARPRAGDDQPAGLRTAVRRYRRGRIGPPLCRHRGCDRPLARRDALCRDRRDADPDRGERDDPRGDRDARVCAGPAALGCASKPAAIVHLALEDAEAVARARAARSDRAGREPPAGRGRDPPVRRSRAARRWPLGATGPAARPRRDRSRGDGGARQRNPCHTARRAAGSSCRKPPSQAPDMPPSARPTPRPCLPRSSRRGAAASRSSRSTAAPRGPATARWR